MRKGRSYLGRHHHGKRSSTVALVLSMLLMLTIVLLVLLALGIFSLPIGSDDSSSSSSYLRDRITFKRKRLLVICSWRVSRTLLESLLLRLNPGRKLVRDPPVFIVGTNIP